MSPEAQYWNLDGEKISQVLNILIENALKYSDSDSIVEVSADMKEQRILFSVSDRGQGIPQSMKESIFDRFYQIKSEYGKSAQGLGLGLYIARNIVEAHNGMIWNESRDGGGSVFTFSLPFTEMRGDCK